MNVSNKRLIIISALIVFIVVPGIILLMWYNRESNEAYPTFVKPRIEMSHVVINRLTIETTDMNVSVVIDNPMPAGIELKNMDYVFYIAGIAVAKDKYENTIDIDGNGKSEINIPVIIDNKAMLGKLKELEEQGYDSTDYTISLQGSLSVLFINDKPIDFDYTMSMPVIEIPKAEIQDVKIESVSFKDVDMHFDIQIENPNIFPLRIKDMNYLMEVDEDSVVSGNIAGNLELPAEANTTIKVPVQLKTGEAVETAFDAIVRAKSTEYLFHTEFRLISDDNMLQNSLVILDLNGDLKQLSKLVLASKKDGEK